MKFNGSLEINKPPSIVSELFANPAYLGEYQDGFVKKELVSGEAGQEGTVSRLYYQDKNRDMVLTETITKNNLPDSIEAFYHHKHMDNTMKCNFISISDERTRFEYEFEYTRINWFLPKLIAILFPGMYRKQGEKWMRKFKEFVERQSKNAH